MGSLGSANDAGWKDGAATFNISSIVGGNRVGEWVSGNMTHRESAKAKQKQNKWKENHLSFLFYFPSDLFLRSPSRRY